MRFFTACSLFVSLNWRYTIRIHSFVVWVARFSHAIHIHTIKSFGRSVGFPDIILILNGLWLSRCTIVVEQSTRFITSDYYQKRREKKQRHTQKNICIRKHVLSLIILPYLWIKFFFLCSWFCVLIVILSHTRNV